MFQPTHPKARAEKSLKAIERELYEQEDILERAQHSIAFLKSRRSRLERYVMNYEEVDFKSLVNTPIPRVDIPQAL